MKVLERRCVCNGELNSNGQGECNSSDEYGPFCYVDRWVFYAPLLCYVDFDNQRLRKTRFLLGGLTQIKMGSNILINHPFSSDTTCGDVRAQYFFVWGVSNPKSSILVTCHWQGASGLRYLSNEACDASTDLSGYARNSWKLSWTHPYIKYIYHISHISMNYISKTVQ